MAHQRVSIYIIIDLLANQIAHIFTSANDAAAIRLFQDAMQQPQTIMSVHPEDFCLRHIGVIDALNLVDPADNRVVMFGKTLVDISSDKEKG